jgi:membrane protease YdiL (CAAX protease family)
MTKSKSLIVYLILAYFFSWIIFILLALNHHKIIFLFPDDAAHARTADVWHAFGALGPFLGAVITLNLFSDKIYWKQFREGYAIRKITLRGWIVSLSPILFFVFAIIVNGIITQHWIGIQELLDSNNIFTLLSFVAWFLPSLFYGFFEEAGWRGFALPVLQTKYSAIKATAILTAFWIGWHVPSFFYRYNMNVPALIGFAFGIFAGAIILTFIFNYTKGSILAVSIWHLTYDMVSMICKEGMIPAIVSTLIIIFAIGIVLKYKGKNLSPFERISLT